MSFFDFDVVVMGAGMFGAAAAKYLGQSGARVLLVGPPEPRQLRQADPRAFGAYFDQARICRRLGWDDVWGTLDASSLNRFAAIEESSGIRFFHEVGSLVLMANSIGRRSSAMVDRCIDSGITVERLPEALLPQRFDGLCSPIIPGGVEGLYEESCAGYLNPRRLVEAQIALAVNAGVTLLRGIAVAAERDRVAGSWRLVLAHEGGSLTIDTEKVLAATGSFTNQVGVLPEGCSLDMVAFTEPNLLFELDRKALERFQPLPCVVTVDPEDTGNRNRSSYLLPPIRYPDGKWYMRIGPGMQPIVEKLETLEALTAWYRSQQVTTSQYQVLHDIWQELTEECNPVAIRQSCCIIEKTASCYPYLGPLPGHTSYFVAVGGNGHGARGSDEIGRLAANMVLERHWDSPLEQATFMPMLAGDNERWRPGSGALKPPFGLC
jgi:sarcosine oxidase